MREIRSFSRTRPLLSVAGFGDRLIEGWAMRRGNAFSLTLAVLGCIVAESPARASEEWRPVVASPQSQVRLGLPAKGRIVRDAVTSTNPTSSAQEPVTDPLTETLLPRRATAQYFQAPDAPSAAAASAAEDQFNCGVIREEPRGRHPWFDGRGGFFHRLFGCGEGGGGLGGSGAGGGFGVSDKDFNSFISPVSNPFFFEDPRALTEFRPTFLYQKAPSNNPLLDGGNIYYLNFQGRFAFNERWSLVLHRIGVAVVDPGSAALGGFEGGTSLTDLQLGPKWTFYRDDRTGTLGAIGVNFGIPLGDDRTLGGAGMVAPYFSGGQKFGDLHLLGTVGYQFAYKRDYSDFVFLSLHADYSFFDRFYPLVELNYYYYTRDGRRLVGGFEGGDLFNLGATDAGGHSLLTGGVGFRFKFTESIQTGVLIEMPLLSRDDLMRYRLTLDLIFRY